jgi:hypothetical protein
MYTFLNDGTGKIIDLERIQGGFGSIKLVDIGHGREPDPAVQRLLRVRADAPQRGVRDRGGPGRG